MRLFLTGRRFDAREALGYGLFHRVVPADGLVAAVEEEIDAIARCSEGRRRGLRRLVRTVSRLPMDEAFAWTEAKIAELFASPEAAEGMAAFAAKRKPSWVPGAAVDPPTATGVERRPMTDVLRIADAAASTAIAWPRRARWWRAPIDVLTGDYLAELTLMIL